LTSPDFPCTCICCSCFRWWRHRWFCCKVVELKRRGTRVHDLGWSNFKKIEVMARTSDIFGWNLSTKNVDIYCSWCTLNVSYRILEVWSRNVRCISPNLLMRVCPKEAANTV
jgi:hypothetical protein